MLGDAVLSFCIMHLSLCILYFPTDMTNTMRVPHIAGRDVLGETRLVIRDIAVWMLPTTFYCNLAGRSLGGAVATV